MTMRDISILCAAGGLALTLAVVAPCTLAAQTPATDRPDSVKLARVAAAQALPPLDGRRLKATLVEVRYSPGGSSPPHSHPCPVIGYVVKGTLRNQVAGEPVRTYRAGETFYEPPNGVHAVSANASQTDSVIFLAYFTCDREGSLSGPPPGASR